MAVGYLKDKQVPKNLYSWLTQFILFHAAEHKLGHSTDHKVNDFI
jgi:hypothetical protein